MSRFEFLQIEQNTNAFAVQIEVLEGFLFERSINMLYARAGTGKTWLCFALAKCLVQKGFDVLYLDPDNPYDLIKKRGYETHIKALNGKLTYINGDLMDDMRLEMNEANEKIVQNAKLSYDKCVFIYDGLKFFLGGSMYDETKIDKLVMLFKRIRKAGGTVIVI
ncbi:MAG: AAA family ATPase, partial [Sulfurospirillaceae bacterium]|nr:AAA family ATPase [Sulfurospirillaceae bacterium]